MISLKSYGPMRFVAAGFLAFWLCGWLAGECFGLWFLGNGLVAVMSGTPFLSGRAPVQVGPALAVGAFLTLWLTLWTVGGIAAISEFLRLVAGEDQLSVEGGRLTVMHRRGPFHRRREFPRDALRRLYLTPGAGCALAVEVSGATVELSRLGTLEERNNAAKTLRSELGLSDADTSAGLSSTLPKGWEEIITPEGERAVVPSRGKRRVQARVAAALAFLMGALAVALVPKSFENPGVIVGVIQLGLGAVALTCATVWLGRGRMEWRIGSGRVTLRRRFGSRVKDVFEAQRFELTLDRSSEHGDWFALDAVRGPSDTDAAGAGPPSTAPVAITVTTTSGTSTAPLATWSGLLKNRRRVTSVANNPSTPRQLGAYLARAAGVSFEDRTTPEARQADLQLIKEQLEKSGPLGRFAVRFVVNVQDRNRKQA